MANFSLSGPSKKKTGSILILADFYCSTYSRFKAYYVKDTEKTCTSLNTHYYLSANIVFSKFP